MGNDWKSNQSLCFGPETPQAHSHCQITCDDFQADSGNWQAIHLMKLGEEDHADGDYSRSGGFRGLNHKWIGPSLFFSEEHSVGRMKFETLPFREQYDLLRQRSVDNKFNLGTCLSREKKDAVGKFHMLCYVTESCQTSKINTAIGFGITKHSAMWMQHVLRVVGTSIKLCLFKPSCDALDDALWCVACTSTA